MADYSLFTNSNGSTFIAVLIYIDDLILAENDSQYFFTFKQYLDRCFHIKDLDHLKYFLGI